LNSSGTPTFRAEISTKDRPAIKSERWYRFSLYLPQDFPIEDNRLVLAQWHGVDKKYLGEPSRSPVMAFRYRRGRFTVTLRHSAERIVRDPDAVSSTELFRTNALPLNEWNDFVVQARWSFEEDGRINIWWNGKQIVQYRGPVGYNDDVGPYFQFGLYRDETDKTYVSYMKQIRLGTNSSSVDFNPPASVR
jgi:Polysaccharide lyase